MRKDAFSETKKREENLSRNNKSAPSSPAPCIACDSQRESETDSCEIRNAWLSKNKVSENQKPHESSQLIPLWATDSFWIGFLLVSCDFHQTDVTSKI